MHVTRRCVACDRTGDTHNKTSGLYDGADGASSKTSNTYDMTRILHDGQISRGELVVHAAKSRLRGLAVQVKRALMRTHMHSHTLARIHARRHGHKHTNAYTNARTHTGLVKQTNSSA